MLLSLVTGYFTMMPDEYKNFGQSLVATTLFSNNILLSLTSGYWDLSSEFKPLLHTWSLGVEEQYYIITPILYIFAWRFFKYKILWMFILIFFSSLFFAVWFVNKSPNIAFYILPTRAWEITLGGSLTILLNKKIINNKNFISCNILSFIGISLILISIFTFNNTILSPSYYLLLPTIGTCLVIVFSKENTIVYKLLSLKPIVFIGLLSYSLYLYHQPIFSLLRIYSIKEPSTLTFVTTIFFIFFISYISFKYIETPFRNKKIFSQNVVFSLAIIGSLFFIISGVILNKNYGIPGRIFDHNIKIEDLDKRIYNERIYSFKKKIFSSDSRKKLLIVGNSFGRDFINIVLETFKTNNVEIIYRDDFLECINPSEKLYYQANIIVFSFNHEYSKKCVDLNIKYTYQNQKKLYYIGIKDFGYNLNWLIRLPKEDLANQYNPISEKFIKMDNDMSNIIPSENYISLLKPILVGNKIPITDDQGLMLSTDRAHLTKYGAIYFGNNIIKSTSFADIFN